MASRSDRKAAARFKEEAEACAKHAAAIREMLAENGNSLALNGAE